MPAPRVLELRHEPSLATYPELPAVRATFLRQLGHASEARHEFLQAAARTENTEQRRLYLDQAAQLDDPDSSTSK